MNNLPAGLLDNSIEFFVCDELKAYKLKDGKVIAFEDFDKDIIDAVLGDMLNYPAKVAQLTAMGLSGRQEMVKQYLVCNYGGFDNKADFVDGVLQPTEYWPCPKRGSCPHEGKLCDSLRTDTGAYLTKKEIEVLELVALGKFDKEIADALNISANTVPTHTKNIRLKTGLSRKADLTRFAVEKNLI
ncbi:MAG: helix-turn-helix transcriptional regulator [Bacteroidota bacterium]